jgi:hypothetical protein
MTLYMSVSTNGQFRSRGFVTPNTTQYGFFTTGETALIKRFAEECGYIHEQDPEAEPCQIKVYSRDMKKYGFLRPLWDKVEDGTWKKKIVYGFYRGKKWVTKYNITPNLGALNELLGDIRSCTAKKPAGQDSKLNVRMMSHYMYRILIKDLENDVMRERIARYYVPER